MTVERFEKLVEWMRPLDLGEPGDTRRPPRENIRALQNTLGGSLAADDFCLDCIEQEVSAVLEARQTPGARCHIPPFFRIPDRGIFFRFYYWPPGKVAPPHEHTSWTVTAVFHHKLQVTTYDWDTALRERRLEQRNVFLADRGKAGHIFDPCIHNPSNETDRLAVSVHVFNSNDRSILGDTVGPIPGLACEMNDARWPAEPVAFERAVARWRRGVLLMNAEMLSRFRSPRAARLLERIFDRGDDHVRFRVTTILKDWDPVRASELFGRLVESSLALADGLRASDLSRSG
jgi:hypothetical protein